MLNRRNNDTIDRNDLISKIAAFIGSKNPTLHKVDLKTPDVVVLVEVFKGMCGMSVIHDFHKLQKYNFESVSAPMVIE
jgi:tRNA acetyltransferase TAN1